MRILKVIFFLSFSFLFINVFSQTIYPDYEDGAVYFKIRDHITLQYRSVQGIVNIDDLPFLGDIRKKYRVKEIQIPFYLASSAVLERTFKICFSDPHHVDEIIKALYQTDAIEYAEKIPILKPAYDTNDPSYPKQWFLSKIKANAAWNYSKGNKKIVVAVVDNAIDIKHPDLKSNIWINPGEIPGNGKDDENDGYIDDINGWDVADNDNDPTPPQNSVSHGTHTAGIVGAVSDNSLGISSLSFGVSVMAVKSNKSSGSGSSSDIFKGITYAANAGADVISLSWSGTGSSQTDQNVMSYAYSKGAVLVVAAGNNNSETKTYPGAYPNVISVASSDESDKKSVFSSYGTWVDITAPGSNIYSTVPGTGYQNMSGTSMACPLVASLCGLMLSLNPSLTQTQLENCLKSSSIPIDANNPGYTGKLGSGRINAEAAMKCVAAITGFAEEVVEESNFVIYPNPAKEIFFIHLDYPGDDVLQLDFFNCTGQKIRSIPVETRNGYYREEVDISTLPEGIYFLHLKGSNQSLIKKIVKS